MAAMMLIKAKDPNVVRAAATVNGPYPSSAMDTTMTVPPQIRPSAAIDSQLADVGVVVMEKPLRVHAMDKVWMCKDLKLTQKAKRRIYA
jgi:hypothetical protein